MKIKNIAAICKKNKYAVIYERNTESGGVVQYICQYLQRWSASRALMKSCPKFEDYDMYKRMMDGDERWLPPALRKAERGMQK